MEDQTWGIDELRRAIEAAGVALWTWNVDDNTLVMDARGYALWDVQGQRSVSLEHLSLKIHPADRDRVRAAFSATRAVVGPYEIDFRIMVGPDVRWISARGQGNDAGILRRTMTGIFLDVTGRKQAEESHELLAGEMSHRVKNLLAVASGLTQITSRSSLSIEDMSRQLTQRLSALGRAHDLVRPLPGIQGKAALLGDLVTVLLAPYDETGAFAGRIRVAVPRMGVGDNAATALALIVHELATNSLKYGALSVATGTLDVSGTMVGNDVEIVWSEQGGPEVKPPTGPSGYGSKLVQRTISSTLGGVISIDWTRSGVLVTMRIDGDKVSR
ncbi:sensor histidine kinase [Rhizobium tumorigenes]|uniref:histidine kinase n=1 Tax=Rhizobium tumorigenes TaxID=2041385 RepID=A0AAF1K4Y1_9HYPH|nr:HWE histidine kinase domain-containing protein [Rhizobium tumorigenes]WFR96073.1 HWE histidine kinase domain-containing protein [Rhizobium tumorigenes]